MYNYSITLGLHKYNELNKKKLCSGNGRLIVSEVTSSQPTSVNLAHSRGSVCRAVDFIDSVKYMMIQVPPQRSPA